MRSPDPVTPSTGDDHCLVHHFIRTHGRRPSPDELRALHEHADAARHTVPASAITRAVRRELAKLVSRW